MPAISIKNLTKKFGEFAAVDRISFDIPKGSIVGLLGGNGAGKTTTLSMLVGILLPSDGEINILGVDMLRQRQQNIVYMTIAVLIFSSQLTKARQRGGLFSMSE